MSHLIADIGGTNARFALSDGPGTWRDEQRLKCADFPGPAEAALAYLDRVGSRPRRAAFAVAAPVDGDRVEMTNHPWRFSIEALRHRLGLDGLEVVNDFVANALAVPLLANADRVRLHGDSPVTRAPVAVIGPGTGLGVALLVPCGDDVHAVATEGGHVTLPAADTEEAAILERLRTRFGHVSAERVLSGPGLVSLYRALDGRGDPTPEDITAGAVSDPVCARALDVFLAMLGTVAGNLALTTGARGGVYLMGGLPPSLIEPLKQSRFAARFGDKGRFADWLKPVPVWVATHPYPAFLGLSGLCAPAGAARIGAR